MLAHIHTITNATIIIIAIAIGNPQPPELEPLLGVLEVLEVTTFRFDVGILGVGYAVELVMLVMYIDVVAGAMLVVLELVVGAVVDDVDVIGDAWFEQRLRLISCLSVV